MDNTAGEEKTSCGKVRDEIKKMKERYPAHSCLYVERSKKCKTLNDLPKNKFLIPNIITADKLIYIVRKRCVLTKEEALFLYVKNKLLNGQITVGELYNKYKSDDGFLYITYTAENCFG